MHAGENPFRVQRIHAVPYLAPGFDWAALLERLERLEFRAVIVGPHGSGKTTLLGELGTRLEKRGFRLHRIRLSSKDRGLPSLFLEREAPDLGSNDIVLLDGAEQLVPRQWRRFDRATRGARGLIVTSHAAVRLPVLIESRTSTDTLDAILKTLVPDRAEEFRPLAHALYRECEGDVRAVLFALYDHCARDSANTKPSVP